MWCLLELQTGKNTYEPSQKIFLGDKRLRRPHKMSTDYAFVSNTLVFVTFLKLVH